MLKVVGIVADGCRGVIAKRLYLMVFALFGAFLFFCSPEVFAQGGGSSNTVEFESLVSFGSIFDSIKAMVVPIIVGAVALGLGIWGVKFAFRLVKSFGRG